MESKQIQFRLVESCNLQARINKTSQNQKGMKNIYKGTSFHHYQQFKQMKNCCICGQVNCQQSFDHQKITLIDLLSIINQKRSNVSQIQEIKVTINNFYQNLKKNITSLLEKDRYEVLTFVNKFYFPKQYCQKNKIDVDLISHFMEKNINKLPSKKIGKLIKKVQSIPLQSSSFEIEALIQKSQQLTSSSNILKFFQSLKMNLPSKLFNQDQLLDLQLKQKKSSFSQIMNPQQENKIQKQKIYEWRNIRVTKNSRTVSLSNKNISDLEVMQQVPILANYRNLKELQIRNNKISCLSCNLIANNMPFLVSLDIRSNRIGDKGIIKLIKGIPKLKQFFISQTLATDLTGQQIISKLHDLEMLWAEHTNLSNEVALKIASKPKLKVLSLVGNPIDDLYKEKMKKIFISKGYVTV